MCHRHSFALLITITLLCGNPPFIWANDGDPVAVRNWPGGMVSVETHWGLHLVINPEQGGEVRLEREPHQLVSPSDSFDHYLFRKPNAAKGSWLPAAGEKTKDPNSVHVQTIRRFGNEPVLQIEVDGVQIVYVPKQWFAAQSNQDTFTVDLQNAASPDLLVLATPDLDQLMGKGTALLLKFAKPKAVLLNRINVADQPKLDSLAERFGAEVLITQRDHNTIAVSNMDRNQPMQTFVTADTPWVISDSLTGLFKAMEKANKDSQSVFAKLSVNQLNFKPANGTHTPRWNTEHMMGRQLLFFSQIYHAQDAVIPIMDLNPKQMPPDYVFAHPDWDGAEESRQMQRINDFTRRFAYLLNGIELDKKAPGSRWTLRGLLKQMERHYGEHTANTIKKFDLPDWPKK